MRRLLHRITHRIVRIQRFECLRFEFEVSLHDLTGEHSPLTLLASRLSSHQAPLEDENSSDIAIQSQCRTQEGEGVCVCLYIVFQSSPFHRVESAPSFTSLGSLPLSFKRLAHPHHTLSSGADCRRTRTQHRLCYLILSTTLLSFPHSFFLAFLLLTPVLKPRIQNRYSIYTMRCNAMQ